jgi:hypothetical protein
VKRLTCALVVALGAVSRAAGAAGIELHECHGLNEVALREHLSLELTTLGLSSAPLRLQMRCTGSVVIIALTADAGHRYPIEARVELGETARAERERLVALAASELIAQAERARSERAVEALPPATSSASADAKRAVAKGALRPHELFVALSAAVDGAPKTMLWGGGLGARLALDLRWSLLVDMRFERGDARLALADVRWSSLSGFIGAAAVGGAPLAFSMGLGVRAGWLAFDTRPASPQADTGQGMTAPWAGIALPLRLALETRARLRPWLGLEGGYVVLPVRGTLEDGRELSAKRGPWFAASVGLGVSL